jgi:hypothetical protein
METLPGFGFSSESKPQRRRSMSWMIFMPSATILAFFAASMSGFLIAP